MAITDEEFASAGTRMAALREAGYAASARYDRRTGRIVVMLHTGIQLAVPSRLLEGLAGAAPHQHAAIEVRPAGLGLHRPTRDAAVYLPALLGGVFGSRRWMAELGAAARPDADPAGAAARRSTGA